MNDIKLKVGERMTNENIEFPCLFVPLNDEFKPDFTKSFLTDSKIRGIGWYYTVIIEQNETDGIFRNKEYEEHMKSNSEYNLPKGDYNFPNNKEALNIDKPTNIELKEISSYGEWMRSNPINPNDIAKLLERFKKIADTTMDSYTKKHIYDAINLYDKQ